MAIICGTDAVEAEDNLGGGAFPRNCGSWHCEICAPQNQARLRRKVRSGQPNRFITITCREGQFPNVDIGAERLAWAWKIVVKRWKRLKPTNKCEYLVVREAQKNGWPHLHIAWRGDWIDREWLSAQMAELLNSPQTDVKLIRGAAQVAYYIAKYMGKEPHRFGTLKRYWSSKNYCIKKDDRHKPIFRKELRFRPRGRTMYQVRDELDRWNVDYTVLYGKMMIWHTPWVPPPKREKIEPKRLLYHNGFLRYHTSKGWGLPPDGT